MQSTVRRGSATDEHVVSFIAFASYRIEPKPTSQRDPHCASAKRSYSCRRRRLPLVAVIAAARLLPHRTELTLWLESGIEFIARLKIAGTYTNTHIHTHTGTQIGMVVAVFIIKHAAVPSAATILSAIATVHTPHLDPLTIIRRHRRRQTS